MQDPISYPRLVEALEDRLAQARIEFERAEARVREAQASLDLVRCLDLSPKTKPGQCPHSPTSDNPSRH